MIFASLTAGERTKRASGSKRSDCGRRSLKLSIRSELEITMMGSTKDAALTLLLEQAGVTVQDVKFFKGDAVTFTADEFWGEVHSALLQERMGTAIVSQEPPTSGRQVNAELVLASL